MRRMREIRMLIIILIAVVTLVAGTFAILYFATDIFKSNKSLFKKYVSQVELNSFMDLSDLYNYEKRLEEEEFSSEGEVKISLGDAEESDESINEKIEYTSINNPKESVANAKLNYIQDDEKNITINYIKEKDLYGVQFQDIVNQYIAFENKNIKQFVEKMGVKDTEDVPDKIEVFNNETINIEEASKELKSILNKYLNIASKEIPDKNYTKIKKEQISVEGKTIEAEGYNVVVTGEDLINIINKCIDEIKNDEKIYKYVNNFKLQQDISFSEYQSMVEDLSAMVEDIKDEMKIDLNISVYKQGNKLIKLYAKLENSEGNGKSYIEASIENNKIIRLNCVLDTENITSTPLNVEFNISISKNTSKGQENGVEIFVEAKANNEQILKGNLVFSKYGKSDSENVKTEFSIDAEVQKIKCKLDWNHSTKFGLSEEIETFKEDNKITVNDLSTEQLNNLIRNLSNLVFEKIDAKKSILGNYILMYEQTLNASQDALKETKKALVKEAIAVTQANIIADYYGEEITDVAIQIIQQEMQKNLEGGELQGANIGVNETGEIGKYSVAVEGVELDEENSILDLSVLFQQ